MFKILQTVYQYLKKFTFFLPVLQIKKNIIIVLFYFFLIDFFFTPIVRLKWISKEIEPLLFLIQHASIKLQGFPLGNNTYPSPEVIFDDEYSRLTSRDGIALQNLAPPLNLSNQTRVRFIFSWHEFLKPPSG